MAKMTLTEIRDKILEGHKLAFKRLIEKKKKEDSFIYESHDGKVVKVMARDIKL